MVFFQLLAAAIGFGIEQLLQSRYGTPGLLALSLLAIGIHARNRACVSLSVLVFMLLMAQA
ncbi:hypothetical protein OG302_22905 [Streptomyces sp. NBC_01283]|uniref:hypothetical protein n=1 Tax=Streptomyces sp. NBC_01283 TaxID=2903812 RepID=UPI00352E18CB|nr:hypothetical protein OG302_22905 [Streptomyces sp. NBC_01283]